MILRQPRTIGRVACFLGLGVLGFAGVGKLVDLWDFYASLGSWALLPSILRAPLAIALPVAEVLLLALWLGGWRRRRVEEVAIGLMLSMTLFIGVHLATTGVPKCHCLGAWSAFVGWFEDGVATLLKAALVLVVLSTGRLLQSLAVFMPPRPTDLR